MERLGTKIGGATLAKGVVIREGEIGESRGTKIEDIDEWIFLLERLLCPCLSSPFRLLKDGKGA
jgi:hypothetical protein